MRKIMFRGKCDDKWHFGDLLHAFYDNELVIEERDIRGCIIRNRIVPATVGQFTGLLDRNGKEIYEGDIIEVNRADFIFHSVVFWYKSGFMHKGPGIFSDSFSNVKVIGNVHDNSGLLEATHD